MGEIWYISGMATSAFDEKTLEKLAQLDKSRFPEPLSSVEAVESIELVSVEKVEKKPIQMSNWMHQAAILMLAERGDEQIALDVGKPLSVVMQLRGLPEFRKIIETLTVGNEEESAKKLIKGSLVGSVMTLIRLRDSAGKEDIRFKASVWLLEHELGKAVDKVKAVGNKDKNSMQELMESTPVGVSPEEAIEQMIRNTLEQNPEMREQFGIKS